MFGRRADERHGGAQPLHDRRWTSGRWPEAPRARVRGSPAAGRISSTNAARSAGVGQRALEEQVPGVLERDARRRGRRPSTGGSGRSPRGPRTSPTVVSATMTPSSPGGASIWPGSVTGWMDATDEQVAQRHHADERAVVDDREVSVALVGEPVVGLGDPGVRAHRVGVGGHPLAAPRLSVAARPDAANRMRSRSVRIPTGRSPSTTMTELDAGARPCAGRRRRAVSAASAVRTGALMTSDTERISAAMSATLSPVRLPDPGSAEPGPSAGRSGLPIGAPPRRR